MFNKGIREKMKFQVEKPNRIFLVRVRRFERKRGLEIQNSNKIEFRQLLVTERDWFLMFKEDTRELSERLR